MYRMKDGTVVDPARATEIWEEASDWDGNNHISRVTGSQWKHQKLYRSKKGRYYVEHTSQYQGSRSHFEWVSREEAAQWLMLNEHELPEDLADLAEEVCE